MLVGCFVRASNAARIVFAIARCVPLRESFSTGATQIHVTAVDGGIKSLQVQDNGRGVQVTLRQCTACKGRLGVGHLASIALGCACSAEPNVLAQAVDLPLLCVRHATSKLRVFEELRDVNTLGFRGEALASISFAAHVTVTTMTEGQAHGTRATYRRVQHDSFRDMGSDSLSPCQCDDRPVAMQGWCHAGQLSLRSNRGDDHPG